MAKYNVVLIDKTMNGKRRVLSAGFETSRVPKVNEIIDMCVIDDEDDGDLMAKPMSPEPHTIVSVVQPIQGARPGFIVVTQSYEQAR